MEAGLNIASSSALQALKLLSLQGRDTWRPSVVAAAF
jgi:hypothetical protein